MDETQRSYDDIYHGYYSHPSYMHLLHLDQSWISFHLDQSLA